MSILTLEQSQPKQESVWYFQDINLYKILCPHKYKAYRQQHQTNDYKRKDYIYFGQESAQKVYLIEHGKVKIGYYNSEGEEVVKAILSKGEIFGESALLGRELHEEFAQAIETTTCICPILADTMQAMMRENQNFSLSIYKLIGLRLRKIERRLQLLLFKDGRTRLEEFLLDLNQEYGTMGTMFAHPYTQKDMATLVGISRPTLNILMNQLKDEGFIEFGTKKLKIIKALQV